MTKHTRNNFSLAREKAALRRLQNREDLDVVAHFNRTVLGIRLRELRVECGLSQGEMAREFGIDRSFISDVERGRKAISLNKLNVIARGFGISLSDLLQGL